MYMPTLARFTALDPMPPDGEPVLLGGIPDGIEVSAPSNLYSYAANSPLNYADPSGQVTILLCALRRECTFDKCEDKDTKSTFTKKEPKNCNRPKRKLQGKHLEGKKLVDGVYCVECKAATCGNIIGKPPGQCKCNPDVVPNKKTGADDPICNCVLPEEAW